MPGLPSVYLDYNATTPTLPEVVEVMMPYFHRYFGNAASGHLWGKEAAEALEKARTRLAELLEVTPQELIFTSGATEGLNLALFGLTAAYQSSGRHHLLIAATEHKAVLEPAQILQKRGWTVELLPVTARGEILPETLAHALRPDTLAVAVMLANNETGVIQPVAELAQLAHEKGAFFICDTTQAIGKIPVSLAQLGVDLAVVSAHKFYGPKGIGALYVRRRNPRTTLQPLIYGGGHERGLRSGTLPVPLIVGMATALEKVTQRLSEEKARLEALRYKLWEGIRHLFPAARWNSQGAPLLPNTLSVTFPGLKASDLLARMPLVAAATGSACTSARPEPSHVLLAMGFSPEEAKATLRFSLGLPTTAADIEAALGHLAQALRELQPKHAESK
ncbi:MAG: cysteine desulfurase [Bacteroidia bacterium]|nr:cysteine desulfurase [Bacteroidia bacterium]MDW8088161.1 cysteine desulfurase family protein [Bacteroidia bacterium]